MSASFAEVSPLVSGAKGIWMSSGEAEDSRYIWKAHWIWDSDETSMLLARKCFDLSSAPDLAVLRITASSKYQLYINGSYVLQGPARSAPHHQSYDILDISGLLQAGENLIAVRIHYRKGKFSYHHKGRAGLLAQLKIVDNGKDTTLSTDSSWKLQIHHGTTLLH